MIKFYYNEPKISVSNHGGTTDILIRLNGESQTVPSGMTVLQLLQHLQIDPARVAVEFNRAILRKNLWLETAVEAGAQVEIVEFVGGG